MKKNYLSKSLMSKAISENKGISMADAQSRISRLKLEEYQTMIEIEGVKHTISYFKTPDKFLN